MTGGVLVEGDQPFLRRVPWRLLLPRGRGGPAPLLVALHGKGDGPARIEAEAGEALPRGWALLVPSGPVPRDRSRDRTIGDSWYLYDGDTPAFREALRRAEEHVLGILARVLAAEPPRGAGAPDPRRVAVLGFSQGAYLAGTLAVRNPRVFRAAVLVAGRLKHEALREDLPAARGVRILGLHGRDDRSVPPGPSRRSIEAARAAGLRAEFREFAAGHAFTPAMRAAARRWLGRLRRG